MMYYLVLPGAGGARGLFFLPDYGGDGLAHGAQGGGVDEGKVVRHRMPDGAEASVFAVVGHDVRHGQPSGAVDGEMVVGNVSSGLVGEILAVPQGGCLAPYLRYDGSGIVEGVSFLIERGSAAAHHVEQYAETGGVVFPVGTGGPVLRAETPGGFVVFAGSLVPLGRTGVFSVEEEYVDSEAGSVLGYEAGYFEQYAYSAGAVVGSGNGLAVVLRIGVGIGPGTRVPVGHEEDA